MDIPLAHLAHDTFRSFYPGGDVLNGIVLVQIEELFTKNRDFGQNFVDGKLVLHHETLEL